MEGRHASGEEARTKQRGTAQKKPQEPRINGGHDQSDEFNGICQKATGISAHSAIESRLGPMKTRGGERGDKRTEEGLAMQKYREDSLLAETVRNTGKPDRESAGSNGHRKRDHFTCKQNGSLGEVRLLSLGKRKIKKEGDRFDS